MKSNFKKLFEDKEINLIDISEKTGINENKIKILYYDETIQNVWTIGELKEISDLLNVKLSQLIGFEDDEKEESALASICPTNEFEKNDTINPQHYQNGEIDLIESWRLTYPENEFIAGMEMIADRYVKRHRHKNGVEDLDKAIEYLERLKEYEGNG